MGGLSMTDFDIIESAIKIADLSEREQFLKKAATGDSVRFRLLLGQVQQVLSDNYEKTKAEPGATPAEMGSVLRAHVGHLSAGTLIGPYKLLQLLGEGGMGAVWMAEQEKPVRRMVAVKAIKPGLDSAQVLARFEAERQALALMDHPNIAKVLDAGTTEKGHPYFVMELVKGISLIKYCDDHQLDIRSRLELFIPVCHAIQHAHQKGIIHRDLKPSNVLVAQFDGHPVPKVIDFGVAKAVGSRLTEKTMFTGFGSVIGTLEYMSPEQAEFNALDVDTRSDIYSLGVLLYELLTGSTPLGRDAIKRAAFDEVLRRIKEEEPPKPSTRLSDSKDSLPTLSAQRHVEPAKLPGMVRGDLDWIVMKALAKERERRYESANSFAIDVMKYLHDEPVSARPPGATYLFRKFVRRHRAGATAAAVALIALVSAAIISSAMYVKARDALISETDQRLKAEAAQKQAVEEQQRAVQARNNMQASLNFFRNAVLKSARPMGKDGGLGVDVKLIDALLAAEEKIEPNLGKFPHVEASVRQVLGNTFYEIGHFDRAVVHLNRAYLIRKGDPEAQTAWTRNSQNNLIAALGKVGKHEEALVQCEEFVKELRADSTARPENTLVAEAALAECYRDVRRVNDAFEAYSQLIPKMDKEFGPEHYFTLTTRSNYGRALLDAGQHEQGLKVLREVLETRKTKLGPSHFDTYLSMLALASASIQIGKDKDGLEEYSRAFRVAEQLKIVDHVDTVNALEHFAQTNIKSGQWESAVTQIGAWLPMLRTDEWTTYRVRSLYGAALSGKKMFVEAEVELKVGYEGLQARKATIPKAQRGRVLADAAERIGDHFAQLNNVVETQKWHETARKHRDSTR